MRQLLAVLALGLVTAVPTATPDASIEDVLDHEMAASAVPGVAYAVVVNGTVTAVGARGVARGSDAVTPDTPFEAGSITKSVTALAVMQLVEAGEVDLDAPISRYVDTFAGAPASEVTIRQLLSHTSGFSTLQGNAAPATPDPTSPDVLERRVDQLAGVVPAHPAGERWEYSNLNYQILGRLIEVVAGQEYQAYVTAHVLEPVGMVHSFIADGAVHDEMATGHTPWFGTRRPVANRTDRATAPQGGLVASAGDLALYLAMMMNGQDDVLSAAGKAQMMRPAGGAATFYGFGWFVDSGNGTVWHSGSTPGFESLATMMPTRDAAVVVLVNGGSGVGFGETTQLRNAVTARALGLEYGGEGSRVWQKALFVALVVLPVLYLLSMVWAWWHRGAIRAKTRAGTAGLFSLWFPLVTTLAAAWFVLAMVPTFFGAPLDTISVFQPDMALALRATAVTGVLWSASRLAVAYSGRPPAGPSRGATPAPLSRPPRS